MNKHTKELGERLEKLLQWPGDVKIDTKVPVILQLLKELDYQKKIVVGEYEVDTYPTGKETIKEINYEPIEL